MAKTIKQLEDLTPDPANVNKGSERGHRVIDWSITELGAGRSILADADGVVLAGNKTLEVAADHQLPIRVVQTDGKELVVVQRTDLRLQGDGKEREKARQIAIADNRSQVLSYDEDAEILLAHAQSGIDLSPLYNQDEIDALILSLTPEENGPGAGGDDFDATPEEAQTRVRYGDLWACGEHRVLCGDSTKAEDVGRVMDGEKAEMVWTDPPYGVSVGDKNKWLNSIAPSNRIEENLQNDSLDESGLAAMLVDSFANAAANCLDGASWYVAAPSGPLHLIFGQVLKDMGIWRQTLQWVKNNATFSPMSVSYHWRAEPIFYGWLPNGAHRYHGDRKQTTVWEIDRPLASPDHPTMKPVELIARAIEHASLSREIVIDFFGGSGTTLIACERTNRKARLVEIEPKYVNVILSRWEAETGKQAKLLERLDG